MPTRVFLCLAAGIALAGCDPTQTTTCPPDEAFSAESQKRLAAELRKAVPEAEWPRYVTAYRRLRKACTAVAGVK